MTKKLIFKGAEADVILYKRKNWLFKDRNPKSYRLKELDEKIRKRRTKSEIKLLEKASKVIPVPKLIFNDSNDKFRITMEFIKGEKLSDFLNNFNEKKQLSVMGLVGENISKIHDLDIIHGDLTTSNMIFVPVGARDFKVYFIDFGLGFISNKIEDKTVDLHLLKQALEAKHFKNSKDLFKDVLKSYKSSKNSKKVFERFKKVESRGRYKEKY